MDGEGLYLVVTTFRELGRGGVCQESPFEFVVKAEQLEHRICRQSGQRDPHKAPLTAR